ncbi:MAG: hypothetical protein R2743_02520 [Ilumatobacteraceae bacterium]
MAFAGDSAASGTDETTTTTVSTPMNQMPGTGPMMPTDPTAMTAMMNSTDMSAMHSTMHELMKGTIDDDVLAGCDQAHAAMTASASTTPNDGQPNHEAHHERTGS